MPFFATCPKGLELLLANELTALGATKTKETRAGVSFETKLDNIYRICLWSRLANQIFMPLATRTIQQVEELYQIALRFPWEEHMTVENTFAINVDLINAPFQNNQFAIQRFKDGLADYWRNRCGTRPSVDVEKPDLRFHVLIKNNDLTVSINLSGESLHKRGYRLETANAPLKENLAAALLIRANWLKIAENGGSLFDPMCGSGTFLIEAAMMAGDIAPGLSRDYFGFLQWQEFKPMLWKKLIAEAKERREEGAMKIPTIIGQDSDQATLDVAKENIQRAGLSDFIKLEKRDLLHTESIQCKPGLIITNPPYGERLGDIEKLKDLYLALGNISKECFQGWQLSVFTGNNDLAKCIKMGPEKMYSFFNGTIPCQLFNFIIRAPRK